MSFFRLKPPSFHYFFLSCIFLASCQSSLQESPSSDRPNIIWLMAEDMGQDLVCYGMEAVQTPILDRLAAEGIRYDNCIATNPICSPGRSAMITGMHQNRIGAHHHRSNRDLPLPDSIKPITYYLRQQGYSCILGHDSVRGKGQKTDVNFRHEKLGLYDGETNFGLFDKSGSFEVQDQPFFAQITLNVTHRGDWWKSVREQSAHPVDPAHVVLPPYMADHPKIREQWATYLDQIEYMDAEVGRLLEELQEKGMLENTIIFFVGDNGRCEIRGKGYLYDPGVKVPMIAWGKGIEAAVVEDIVATIDISASILALAGAELPQGMTARPLVGDKKGEPREYMYAARDGWDEINECIRSISTPQYKYIRNYLPDLPWDQHQGYLDFHRPAVHVMRSLQEEGTLSADEAWFFGPNKPQEELYDLEKDPHELINLAAFDDYEEVLNQMRGYMNEWQSENVDQGILDLESRNLNPSKAGPIRTWLQETYPEEWERILSGEIVDRYRAWGQEKMKSQKGS